MNPIYEGVWRMVCIGPGPGPKNVLALRVEDGAKLVVTYSTWKHRLKKEGMFTPGASFSTPRVYTDPSNTTSTREVRQVDLQVGILQVAVRTTRNGRQLFDVSCSDGKTRQVWESGLANAINAFAGSGQAISIRVNVKQNGEYTNESINAFAPPGQALPPDTGSGGGGGFQRGGGGGGGRGGMSPEDKTRIAKMGAQGSASTLVAALFQGAGPEAYAEAVSLMDTLTRKLYTDARSHEKAGEAAQQDGTTVLQPGAQVGAAQGAAGVLPQGQAVTPQAIAAAVPGVQVGAQVLQPGGAADAAAAADVTAQAAAENGDASGVEWN